MLQKISFVKESSDNDPPIQQEAPEIDGKEIAEEYRKLCEGTFDDKRNIPQRSSTNKKLKPNDNLSNKKVPVPDDLFMVCQSGNLEALNRILLRKDFDINRCDNFGWSPLMIASCAGHVNIVKRLLENGANVHCKCPNGRSLRKICEKFKQYAVIRLLEDYSKNIQNRDDSSSSSNNSSSRETNISSSLECEHCGTIIEANMKAHLMSITHQLASRTSSSSSEASTLGAYAHVSQNYKGYQLLRQQGWNGTSGLGVNEDGRKYPVPVKVRQDRTAIGHSESKQTHIEKIVKSEPSSSGDNNLRIPKPKLKHKLANRDKKDRKIAARFRQSFYES